MLFCDVVQFTELKDTDKALRDLTTAYQWLSRLCQVFHLEIVCINNSIYFLLLYVSLLVCLMILLSTIIVL